MKVYIMVCSIVSKSKIQKLVAILHLYVVAKQQRMLLCLVMLIVLD